jgi:AcrR family transcriptional regulator
MPEPTPQEIDDAPRTRDQRVLGRRGAATRAAILDALAAHLAATPWHRASVPALARATEVSAASFYQYFPDLPDAVRALTESLARDGGPLPAHLGPLPAHLGLIVALLDWEERHLGAVDGDA